MGDSSRNLVIEGLTKILGFRSVNRGRVDTDFFFLRSFGLLNEKRLLRVRIGAGRKVRWYCGSQNKN